MRRRGGENGFPEVVARHLGEDAKAEGGAGGTDPRFVEKDAAFNIAYVQAGLGHTDGWPSNGWRRGRD
jgi:hypothetical protein